MVCKTKAALGEHAHFEADDKRAEWGGCSVPGVDGWDFRQGRMVDEQALESGIPRGWRACRGRQRQRRGEDWQRTGLLVGG